MQHIEAFKEYLSEQTKYVEEIRSIKHDMQAHLLVLHYYLKEEKHEKAKTYLESMLKNQKLCSATLVDVGHDMVNAVISHALKKSAASIEFCHSGLLPEEVGIEDMDLCTLFSNLLSNSVEACEKLEHTSKCITLEIKEYGDTLSIIVENPIEAAVDISILGKDTTKEDKQSHGYGIRNIKAVVEKYGGEIDFEIAKNIFRVKILFSEVVKSALIC